MSLLYQISDSLNADRLPCHISDALKYINENLTQLNSVEELASHLGISAPYLSTTFKNAIGTPAIKYIQTKKIAYAKSLLDKDYSVTEACYESGFNDSAYKLIFHRF